MTRKPLEHSAHALQRMTERGFTRADIRWLVAVGIPIEPMLRAGLVARLRKRGYIGRQEAMVTYVESSDRIRIVTVMWIATGRYL